MNIKLKNLRSAEEELGNFLGNIVVTSELAASICGDEVNDAYLEYVVELNNKVITISDSKNIAVKDKRWSGVPTMLCCRSRMPLRIDALLMKTTRVRCTCPVDQVHRTDSGVVGWVQPGYASVKYDGSKRSATPP